MRVPLIVHYPLGATGARANGIVELLNLFPTLCVFAALPTPDTLDGKSFLRLVMDLKAEGKPGAFCAWGNGRTVRTLRWRFTERNDASSELYDHSNDTPKDYNRIANPELATLAKRLQAMLEQEFGAKSRTPADLR